MCCKFGVDVDSGVAGELAGGKDGEFIIGVDLSLQLGESPMVQPCKQAFFLAEKV